MVECVFLRPEENEATCPPMLLTSHFLIPFSHHSVWATVAYIIIVFLSLND